MHTGWGVAHVHADGGLCAGHGDGEAALAVPVRAQLPGGGGGTGAGQECHAAALALGQGALSLLPNVPSVQPSCHALPQHDQSSIGTAFIPGDGVVGGWVGGRAGS